MGLAIGIIETYGMVGAYEGLDVALKTASVVLINKQLTGGGLVTITIEGNVSAVISAVDAAVVSVKQIGCHIVGHVIPRLSDDVYHILRNNELSKITTGVEFEVKRNLLNEIEVETNIKYTPPTGEIIDKLVETKNSSTIQCECEENFYNEDLEKLKVVQLRQLARKLEVEHIDRNKIKFANKEELLIAIKMCVKGGESR